MYFYIKNYKKICIIGEGRIKILLINKYMPKETSKIRRLSTLSTFLFFGFKYIVDYLFYFVSFKYIGHKSITMDDNNLPPH